MTPTFSIIIPVYNVAPYLHACLDSVLCQACADWEAICVDDGSTDGSGIILDEYAERDPRFRVLHQKNAGVSAARNSGLDIACGEWIGFLDADDCYGGNLLAFIAKVAVKHTSDIVRFGTCRFSTEEERLSHSESVVEVAVSAPREMKPVDFWWLFPACFYRRSLIGDLRFTIGMRFGEDMLFSHACVYKAEKMATISGLTGYFYRMRESSATHALVKPCRDGLDFIRHEVTLPAYSTYWDRLVTESVISFLIEEFLKCRQIGGEYLAASAVWYMELFRLLAEVKHNTLRGRIGAFMGGRIVKARQGWTKDFLVSFWYFTARISSAVNKIGGWLCH